MKRPRLLGLVPSSSGDTEKLPSRVQASIEREQLRTERFVCLVQLMVVAVFATLYFLSRKTFPETSITPVPYVLGAYLVFTAARLLATYANFVPRWLLYLSAAIDVALLLGLIWSFHIQYQQPASFFLKAPTLLYIFIFIALRALYFDARYLIFTGLFAAFGWLMLVLYVIEIDPADSMVTRDYIEYLTSNSVLIGAEFDKVISILMVTAILALAIRKARKLLIQATRDNMAARDLSRFVPGPVAARVTTADESVRAGEGELREATILFSDIAGFTDLSTRLSPTDLISTLNAYFKVVSEPIHRHGGVINQFQGDAILATFNLPEQLEGHAVHAVQAALEIQEALAKTRFADGTAIASRIGINTGLVVGGLVGTSEQLGYTVHGVQVNLAARLEQLNKELDTNILLSARARELAIDSSLEFEEMGSHQLRGISTPIEAYSVRRQDLRATSSTPISSTSTRLDAKSD